MAAGGPIAPPSPTPLAPSGLRGESASRSPRSRLGTSALVGRFEYFKDYNGYSTDTAQELKEFTGTYEYKWAEGLLTRVEYRRDWSDQPFFHKGDANMVDAQSTVTVAFVAFFGPKR